MLIFHKTNLKRFSFFVFLFLISNALFSQFFFKTYFEVPAFEISGINEFDSENIDLEIDDSVDLSRVSANSGDFISTITVPALDNPPYQRLEDGKFLKVNLNSDANQLEYEIFNPQGVSLSTFTLSLPNTTFGNEAGAVAEFSNGDLLLPYYYGEVLAPQFGVARVNPTNGELVWQNELPLNMDFNLNISPLVASITKINNNDEIFMELDNFLLNIYRLVKISPAGEMLWNVESGDTSKFPSDLVTTLDGGVWYIFNQVISTITKRDENGEVEISVLPNDIFMMPTDRDEIVETGDGGIMCAGRTFNDDMFTLKLDQAGNVIQANILDNLSAEIGRTTAGERLSSGGFAFAGRTSAFEPFLLTVNENGELETNTETDAIDLELALTTNSNTPPIYTSSLVTLSITNSGLIPATDVQVEFKSPENVVYTGGNEYESSQGSFSSFGDEIWQVGTLAAGETATLTVSYFLLTDAELTPYAQVVSANEIDSDSTPNNGTAPNPVEDDEAVISLNGNDNEPNNLCDNISATVSPGSITLTGASAPHVLMKVFRPDWTTALDCLDSCGETETLTDLPAGSYFVEIILMDENWSQICKFEEFVDIPAGLQLNPQSINDLGVTTNSTTPLAVYPNPASNFVYLNLENTENLVVIKVINLLGEEVKSVTVNDKALDTYRLDLGNLKNGQYLIWILEKDKLAVSKKLLIARE